MAVMGVWDMRAAKVRSRLQAERGWFLADEAGRGHAIETDEVGSFETLKDSIADCKVSEERAIVY